MCIEDAHSCAHTSHYKYTHGCSNNNTHATRVTPVDCLTCGRIVLMQYYI